MQVQTIAVWDIEQKLQEEDILLIDLREKEEYDDEHIKGAISLPYDEIVKEVETLDKQKKFILYCDRGNASLMVGMKLAAKGYEVYTVLGGYLAYKRMKQKENKFRRK